MDATNINEHGNSTEYFEREMVMILSSSGCLITSSADLLNSGSSSQKSTPLCAKEISPG